MKFLLVAVLAAALAGCAGHQPAPAYKPVAYVAPRPQPRSTPPRPPKKGDTFALLVEEFGRGNPRPPTKPVIDYNAKSLQMQKGMTEKQVIDLLGQPLKSEVRTCGAKLGAAVAWGCKSWTYGAPLGDMHIIFSESSGDWRVSGWTVH